MIPPVAFLLPSPPYVGIWAYHTNITACGMESTKKAELGRQHATGEMMDAINKRCSHQGCMEGEG